MVPLNMTYIDSSQDLPGGMYKSMCQMLHAYYQSGLPEDGQVIYMETFFGLRLASLMSIVWSTAYSIFVPSTTFVALQSDCFVRMTSCTAIKDV